MKGLMSLVYNYINLKNLPITTIKILKDKLKKKITIYRHNRKTGSRDKQKANKKGLKLN